MSDPNRRCVPPRRADESARQRLDADPASGGRGFPLRWRLDQIVGVKDAARSLPKLIGRGESVVLSRRGEPQAVLVPIAEYERLWAVNDATTNGRKPCP